MQPNYRLTRLGCYTGIFTQAIICNITPLLFIPIMELYGLTYPQLGILVGVNFVTQVTVDILFSGAIDRYGYRRIALPAILCAVAGLLLFSAAPLLFPDVYLGLLLATMIFAASSGLLEVMVSPIVDALPSRNKGASMSLTHSFYAWGSVVVIVLTTLFVYAFGAARWQTVILLWTLVPAANFVIFFKSPFPPTTPEEKREKPRKLLFQPFFLVGLLAIMLGASTELIMSQWSSAYMEKGLALPKVLGDLLGMCGFAFFMGIGRTYYGIRGGRMNMNRAIVLCASGAAVCYVIVAISPWNWLNILACALCGIGASILWPGTLVTCSERYPMGGAWMFAILAAAGDIGNSIGPWLMGLITDHAQNTSLALWFRDWLSLSGEQAAMRAGVLICAVFPLGAALCHAALGRMLRRHGQKQAAPEAGPMG